MIDTSPEGLAALLRESNHLVPWSDPEPPNTEDLPTPRSEPDPFGDWMLSLPLRPWEKDS